MLYEAFESSRSCTKEARSAFVSLLQACSLSLEWTLDKEDVQTIERYLILLAK